MRWVLVGGRWGGAVLLAALAVGCSHQAEPDRALERLRGDITTLQADRERMAERLSILELAEQGRVQNQQNVPHAALSATEMKPKLPVVRIGARPDEGASPARWEEIDEPAEPAAPVSPIARSRTRTPAARVQALPARGAELTPSNSDAKRAFDEAVALFQAKQYQRSLDGFTAFLVRFPDHAASDRAMYFRGECLYAQGEFARAQAQFEGLLARFPLGQKTPDALLRVGMCQRKIGAVAEADRTFAGLKERYPNSEAARQVPR